MDNKMICVAPDGALEEWSLEVNIHLGNKYILDPETNNITTFFGYQKFVKVLWIVTAGFGIGGFGEYKVTPELFQKHDGTFTNHGPEYWGREVIEIVTPTAPKDDGRNGG